MNNDDFRKEVSRIIAERFIEASKQLPKEPKAISQLSIPKYKNIIKIRHKLSLIIPLFIISILLDYYLIFPTIISLIISISSILIAFSIILITFIEIIKGAGVEIENECQQNNNFFRTYKFIPSINNTSKLLFIYSIGIVSLLLGFSKLYHTINSFTVNLDFFNSLYFAIVTFATIGYGDITPTSFLSKIVVIIEILFSLIILTVIITSAISWIMTQERNRLAEIENKKISRMQRTEEILKIAKLGVYGNLDEIKKEAIRRLKKRKTNE